MSLGCSHFPFAAADSGGRLFASGKAGAPLCSWETHSSRDDITINAYLEVDRWQQWNCFQNVGRYYAEVAQVFV